MSKESLKGLEHYRESCSFIDNIWSLAKPLTEQEEEKYKESLKRVSRLRENQSLKDGDLVQLAENCLKGKIDNNQYSKIVQKLRENQNSHSVWRLPVSRCNDPNKPCGNDRVYGAELWRKVKENQQHLWKGLPGLCDHPVEDDDPGSLKDSCVVWLDMEVDEANQLVWGIGTFIGTLGRLIEEMIIVGGRPGFSTSGFGKLIPGTNIVDPNKYVIERLADVVINPSQQVYADINEDAEIPSQNLTTEYTRGKAFKTDGRGNVTETIREANQTNTVANPTATAVPNTNSSEQSNANQQPAQPTQPVANTTQPPANNTQPTNTEQPQPTNTPPAANTEPQQTNTQPATTNENQVNAAPVQTNETTAKSKILEHIKSYNAAANEKQGLNESKNKKDFLNNHNFSGGVKMQENAVEKKENTSIATIDNTMRRKFIEAFVNKEIPSMENPVDRILSLEQMQEQFVGVQIDEDLKKMVEDLLIKERKEVGKLIDEGSTALKELQIDSLDELKEGAIKLTEEVLVLKDMNFDYKKLAEELTKRNKELRKENLGLKLRYKLKESSSDKKVKALGTKIVASEVQKDKHTKKEMELRKQLKEAVSLINRLNKSVLKLKERNEAQIQRYKRLKEENQDGLAMFEKQKIKFQETLTTNNTYEKQIDRLQAALREARQQAEAVQEEFEAYKETLAYNNDPTKHLEPTPDKLISSHLNFKESDKIQSYYNDLEEKYGSAIEPLKEKILKSKTLSDATKVFLTNMDKFDESAKQAHDSWVPYNVENNTFRMDVLKEAGYETPSLERTDVNKMALEKMARAGLGGLGGRITESKKSKNKE